MDFVNHPPRTRRHSAHANDHTRDCKHRASEDRSGRASDRAIDPIDPSGPSGPNHHKNFQVRDESDDKPALESDDNSESDENELLFMDVLDRAAAMVHETLSVLTTAELQSLRDIAAQLFLSDRASALIIFWSEASLQDKEVYAAYIRRTLRTAESTMGHFSSTINNSAALDLLETLHPGMTSPESGMVNLEPGLDLVTVIRAVFNYAINEGIDTYTATVLTAQVDTLNQSIVTMNQIMAAFPPVQPPASAPASTASTSTSAASTPASTPANAASAPASAPANAASASASAPVSTPASTPASAASAPASAPGSAPDSGPEKASCNSRCRMCIIFPKRKPCSKCPSVSGGPGSSYNPILIE